MLTIKSVPYELFLPKPKIERPSTSLMDNYCVKLFGKGSGDSNPSTEYYRKMNSILIKQMEIPRNIPSTKTNINMLPNRNNNYLNMQQSEAIKNRSYSVHTIERLIEKKNNEANFNMHNVQSTSRSPRIQYIQKQNINNSNSEATSQKLSRIYENTVEIKDNHSISLRDVRKSKPNEEGFQGYSGRPPNVYNPKYAYKNVSHSVSSPIQYEKPEPTKGNTPNTDISNYNKTSVIKSVKCSSEVPYPDKNISGKHTLPIVVLPLRRSSIAEPLKKTEPQETNRAKSLPTSPHLPKEEVPFKKRKLNDFIFDTNEKSQSQCETKEDKTGAITNKYAPATIEEHKRVIVVTTPPGFTISPPNFGPISPTYEQGRTFFDTSHFQNAETLEIEEYVKEVKKLERTIPPDFFSFYLFVSRKQIYYNQKPLSFSTFLELHNNGHLAQFHKSYQIYMEKHKAMIGSAQML